MVYVCMVWNLIGCIASDVYITQVATEIKRKLRHQHTLQYYWYNPNMSSELIQKIASDSVIDTAYEWLCKKRKDYSHYDEVWDIRFRWAELKPYLQRRFCWFRLIAWIETFRFNLQDWTRIRSLFWTIVSSCVGANLRVRPFDLGGHVYQGRYVGVHQGRHAGLPLHYVLFVFNLIPSFSKVMSLFL